MSTISLQSTEGLLKLPILGAGRDVSGVAENGGDAELRQIVSGRGTRGDMTNHLFGAASDVDLGKCYVAISKICCSFEILSAK